MHTVAHIPTHTWHGSKREALARLPTVATRENELMHAGVDHAATGGVGQRKALSRRGLCRKREGNHAAFRLGWGSPLAPRSPSYNSNAPEEQHTATPTKKQYCINQRRGEALRGCLARCEVDAREVDEPA